MKQIVNFSKTRLLAETSYQFHLGIQPRIKSETADKLEITEEAVRYDNGITRMDRALECLSKSVFTSKMNAADDKRDKIIRMLQSQVASPDIYPDIEDQEACRRLNILCKSYKDIVNAAQEKETGMCRNLIQDLRSDAFKADVTKLGLDKWVTRLEEANEEFDAMVEKRISENQTKVTGGVTEPRRQTEVAYEDIVAKVNALARVYGDTKYADFIDYVNARIIYFKTILSHQGVKQSSNLPNNPDIPSSGGGDDRPGEL